MTLQREILLLDLVDDAEAIARYEQWHAAGAVPPEVTASIRDAGIVSMDIYRSGNRLVMMMETDERFDPVRKAEADAANPAVVAWETQMNMVQRPLPWATADAKWTRAERIYSLADQ
jgi:L-rhamnose mutarotase